MPSPAGSTPSKRNSAIVRASTKSYANRIALIDEIADHSVDWVAPPQEALHQFPRRITRRIRRFIRGRERQANSLRRR